nr:EOG090X0BIY [Eulimnadia texana]
MFLLLLLAVLVIVTVAWVVLCVFTRPYPNIVTFPEENFYTDPKTGEKKRFTSIDDPSSVSLSVIVPAYNEETRLPVMLDECLDFLEKQLNADPRQTFEVIIVDDGSSDKTTDIAQKYALKFGTDKLKVLTLVKNRGKGGAVRLGMLRARGKRLLFADADGATKFSELTKLQSRMDTLSSDQHDGDKVLALVCGSRAHLEEEAIASRSLFRTILMKGFHLLVWFFCVRTIRDTQCGFKLLSRSAAKTLFRSIHIERWAFDVELLFVAEKLKVPLAEVAVKWTEIDGSKVTPFWSWLQMGRDLVLIWLRYFSGAWRIAEETKSK